jgi:hypothetical protein
MMHSVKKLLTSLLILGALSAQTMSSASTTGSFEYIENIDPLDDIDRSIIVNTSLDEKGYLVWKCDSEDINMFLMHDGDDEKYEEDKEYSVIYRFDKESAIEMDFWSTGSSTNSIWMDSDYVNDFTLEALQSSQLVLRPIKPGFGFGTLTFKLNGLKESLAKMSCSDF